MAKKVISTWSKKVTVREMPIAEVKTLLYALDTEHAKTELLKTLYSPGDLEIAELLAEHGETSYLDKELLYTLQNKDREVWIALGKRKIDEYMAGKYHILLPDLLKKRKCPELNEYAIAQLDEPENMHQMKNYMAIVEAVGTPEQIKIWREKQLKIQTEQMKDNYGAATILVELQRYDEAINECINWFPGGNYHIIELGRKIAEKHAPNRRTEIANLICDYPPIGNLRYQKLLYDCGKFVWREADAKNAIQENINSLLYKRIGKLITGEKSLSPNDPPRKYYDIAEAMYSCGWFEEQKALLTKNLEDMVKKYGDAGSSYLDTEIANVYFILWMESQSLDSFYRAVNKEIKRDDPKKAKEIFNNIKELFGEKVLDDPTSAIATFFVEQRLMVLECNKEFASAIKLAEKFGMSEKASVYRQVKQIMSPRKR
jgi:hypothetical protein